MTTEGTYVYACPMPDHNDLPGIQGGFIPTTGTVVISTGQNDANVQSLIDTVAAQQEEIETLKQALELALSYMTARQREALKYMATLLAKE